MQNAGNAQSVITATLTMRNQRTNAREGPALMVKQGMSRGSLTPLSTHPPDGGYRMV
jgi:hypothetical protein